MEFAYGKCNPLQQSAQGFPPIRLRTGSLQDKALHSGPRKDPKTAKLSRICDMGSRHELEIHAANSLYNGTRLLS